MDLGERFCEEVLVTGPSKCMMDDQGLKIQKVAASEVGRPSLTAFISLSVCTMQDTI